MRHEGFQQREVGQRLTLARERCRDHRLAVPPAIDRNANVCAGQRHTERIGHVHAEERRNIELLVTALFDLRGRAVAGVDVTVSLTECVVYLVDDRFQRAVAPRGAGSLSTPFDRPG